MNYLIAENLTKSYGEKLLFKNISFGIDRGQKIALIAKNGAGKTSLLNIITRRDIPDSGEVIVRKEIKITYLEQNPEFDNSLTVVQVLFNSENKFIQIIREYTECLSAIEIDNNKENQRNLDEANLKMDAMEAWDYERKVKEILSRLKIGNVNQKISELSGGQKKKIALARAMIEDVDLLILDEPTNHLDIEMIEWLEDLLSKSKLSLLLVTHDRYFLDTVCDEILELDNQSIYKYKGNYSYFIEKKAEREAIEASEVEKAKNTYRKELEWMRRMPKARTTKSKSRIGSFYELEKTAKKRLDEKKQSLDVKIERVGKKILEINNIHKSFDDFKILEDFSYTFKRGERIGVVGPNGVGKSTLFNMIMGNEKVDLGNIIAGQTVKFGYYSQDGLQTEGDKRVIDIVKEIAEVIPIHKGKISASQFLFHFGFEHTTQYNYFSNLSGGERRRLFLLMSLIKNPNFLILDEPTNDLDIYTLNLLEEFLSNFQGCMLIASHDRFFLDKLVDHIFVFKGNGKIRDYHSNYTEYREKKLIEEKKIRRVQKQENPKQEKPKSIFSKPTFKQVKEYESLEKEIEELEKEKTELMEKLNSGESDSENLQKWSIRIANIIKQLDGKSDRWLELSELM